MRNVILYIASSLDGYIAKPGDDLSFLSMVERPGEDYGYAAFTNSVDTIIMGRKTYDWVTKAVGHFPHADKETYIITRHSRPAEGKIRFYTDSLKDLVTQLKSSQGKNIFCDGGAELVQSLLREKLIDEIVLSIIPVLLGQGTKLFDHSYPESVLHLLQTTAFPAGLVQLHYKFQ